MGGDSRCAGTLELEHQGQWRPVRHSDWSLKTAAVVCRELDCGSAVSVTKKIRPPASPVWKIVSSCFQSGYALRDCVRLDVSIYLLDLTCSGKTISDILYIIIRCNVPKLLTDTHTHTHTHTHTSVE